MNSQTDNRPFFSVIIPCYNSGETLGDLLESISIQSNVDDIEVIISDDNSTEPYVDVINQYTDKLKIKFIVTDYNFAPGNTRQKGLSIASGQWITFADHDDYYLPDAFSSVKEAILNNNEKYMVVTNFVEYSVEMKKVLREMIKSDNWMHGKFYNYDNFIVPFNLHFKKDLLTHEDIYFSTLVSCAMNNLGRHPLYIDTFTYVWTARPTTISRRLYDGNKSFLETFLSDYITSTGQVFIDLFNEGTIKANYAIPGTLSSFLYVFFYIQGFKYHKPKDYDRDNLFLASKFLNEIKDTFKLLNTDIFKIYRENTDMYITIREASYVGIGKFIESDDIYTFIDTLSHDHKLLTINDDIYEN